MKRFACHVGMERALYKEMSPHFLKSLDEGCQGSMPSLGAAKASAHVSVHPGYPYGLCLGL